MRRKHTLLLLLLFFSFGTAKEYDLQAILNVARQNSKELRLAKSDMDLSRAQYLEALSNAFPKISVDANYNRNLMSSFFYVSMPDSTGTITTQKLKFSFTNEYNLNATLNQPIYTFGKVRHAVRFGAFYKHAARYTYSYQEQQIIANIKKAFYGAILAHEVLKVSEDSENSAKDNYENVKLKYKSGTVSEFDLLQAENRWRNTIPQTIQARQQYDLAVNRLKSLVNFPLEDDLKLRGTLEHTPLMPVPDQVDIDKILKTRPDYLATLWQKRMTDERVGLEFSQYLPTISGLVTYSYGARSDNFKLENDNDNIVVGINLHIPIFSGMNTTAKYQQAKINRKKAETQLAITRDNIKIEMNNIILRLKETRNRMTATRQGIQTAVRAFEIAETRYDNGLSTQLELKDARLLLDQAKINHYVAVYDYLTAYFDYQLATGQMTFNVNNTDGGITE